ncbi:Uncharacterised protein [Legionella sainthelensi]|nr:Uncharacterised protein [Legionella sainthelensi]
MNLKGFSITLKELIPFSSLENRYHELNDYYNDPIAGDTLAKLKTWALFT